MKIRFLVVDATYSGVGVGIESGGGYLHVGRRIYMVSW